MNRTAVMAKPVTVVCIADLQGMCNEVNYAMLPKGDILLIAGDLAGWGTTTELEEVNRWLGGLPYKHKVIVAGNHDQDLRIIADGHKLFTNAIYLQDEVVEVMGLKIYGTPANEMNQYRFTGDWAFCSPAYLQKAADGLPDGIDIFLTHGPAYGFLDKTLAGEHVGSKELRDAVVKHKPRYMVCGHIHEAHGIEEHYTTTFVNAAICSRSNEMLGTNGRLYYEPIVIEVIPRGA